ncbi:hypothetical protein ACS0TY_008055 [Phlomoides rotata]
MESMKGRWKRLSENANKWIVAYKEAYRRKRSGIAGMSQMILRKKLFQFMKRVAASFMTYLYLMKLCVKIPSGKLN